MSLPFQADCCNLCPRRCGANRRSGMGYCRMPIEPVLARAAIHHWEEPCLSGTRGAGAVFFSGCSLGCVYCQNFSISQELFGQAISSKRLRSIFNELIGLGAHTIDLVNPSHYAHAVLEALEEPLPVPVVWNSGGYDRVATLKALEGKISIYLPDFKYTDGESARRYSGAEDYPQVARRAICEMARQTGPYQMGADGLFTRGVLIRHLLLPGQLRQAKKLMDWIAAAFPPHTVLFSLMSQFTPLGRASAYPELNRSLRDSEIRSAIEYMQALGLEGYRQERSAATAAFVPAFDLTGI